MNASDIFGVLGFATVVIIVLSILYVLSVAACFTLEKVDDIEFRFTNFVEPLTRRHMWLQTQIDILTQEVLRLKNNPKSSTKKGKKE